MFKLGALVGLIAGYFLALAIQGAYPSFPAGGMALVTATSAALGALWYAKAITRRLGLPEKPIGLSRPVETLSLWFFGLVYSGILAGILGSYAFAAIAIVFTVFGVAGWHSYQSRQHRIGYYVYLTAMMLSGMASLLVFVRYATASL